jgi:uncharacterized protein YdgA (DUF945 family)
VNRGLRIGLIVVVLALAYPAAAWVIGLTVQHQILQREQLALEQVPYFEVVNRDYRRGVYSSTEELTLGLGGSFAKGFQAAVGQDLSKQGRIVIRLHIHHGPLPQLSTFALATIDTEIALPPEAQQKLVALIGDQAHLTIQTRMHWLGGSTTVIHSTAFKSNLPNEVTFEWRGLEATGELAREVGATVGELTAPGFSVTSSKGTLTMEDFKGRTDAHRAFDSFAVGKFNFSVGHIASEATTPPFKLDARNLGFEGNSSVNGEFLNTDITASLGSLELPKFSGTELVWETRLDHFHGPTLVALSNQLKAIQAEQLRAPIPSGPDDTAAQQAQVQIAQKYQAAVQTYGIPLLGHEPVIDFPRIGFKTPDGDLMLSLKLEFPGITPADVAGDPKTLALTVIPKFLQATVNARMDSTLLDKLLQQSVADSDKSDQVKARIQQLQDHGYIKVDGKALTTQILFMGGQLRINGLPFNPAAFQPPQPQQPPPAKGPPPRTPRRIPH